MSKASSIEPIEIKTMKDFLALSPEQRARCVPDMLAWAAFIDAVMADPEAAKGIIATPIFSWSDDGRVGEIGEVRIQDKDGNLLGPVLSGFPAPSIPKAHVCAFCGAGPAEDRILVAGPVSDICEECVAISQEAINEERAAR